MRKIYFLITLWSCTVSAQEKLTLQQAIEIGLNNNYSIIIAKNESQIANNNVTLGNAGFLPEVNLNLIQNNSLNNTNQKYSTGNEVNKTNAATHSLTAAAALDWTLFDGLKMFASYNKLKELNAMGELNARQMLENTVADINAAYYDVIRQKVTLSVIDSSSKISEVKLKIAKTKFE